MTRPPPSLVFGSHARALAALATLVLGSGCGGDPVSPSDVVDAINSDADTAAPDTTPPDGGTPDATTPPAATIRFALPESGLPAPLAVPFPTDLYRDGAAHDGPIVDTLSDWSLAGITESTETLRAAYAGLDGFGHTSGALFRIDFAGAGAELGLEAATLPATAAACLAEDSPIAIIDVTDAQAPRRLPCVASWFAPLHVLVVTPEGQPLLGGHRYAVIIHNNIATTDGGHLGAPPAFRALVTAPRTSAAATLYGTALDRALVALPGWSAAEVAGMAVYSAHTEHRKLRTARDALVAGEYGAAPSLITDAATAAPYAALRFCSTGTAGCAATLDDWLGQPLRDESGHDVPGAPGEAGHPEPADTGWPHDAIGVVIQGAFTAPELRRPWNNTPEPDDGTFEWVAGKALAQPDAVAIPVTIILPKTPPPATGYPVVVFSHGTPTNRQFVMTFANELARAGVAVVAMDGLYHGTRHSSGKDLANTFPGSYVGPDGFSDRSDTPSSTIDLSASLQSAPRYRANLWQYAIEWCQLRRLITNPALDLSIAADQYADDTTLRFDATRVGWLGTSFGAFTGAALLAVEPGFRAFFLNVGNGDGLQWQGQSPSNRAQIELVLFLFGMGSDIQLTRFTPFVSIAFGALEPGFAASSVEDVDPTGPDILMTEVEYDEYVPNRSTELLAAALGVPAVVPAGRVSPLLATAPSPVTATTGKPARGLVHMGSAGHSANVGRRWGQRNYEFPVVFEDAVRAPFRNLTPPLWVRQPVVATQAMMVRFFTTSFAGAAVIDSAAIPRGIDFDDDGWCDATEQAAGTDWIDPAAHPATAPDCTWDPGY